MKKIGILFGMENTFPQAFIDRVNSKGEPDIIAEAVHIDKVVQADPTEYAVIIDRISQDVPFYRAYLKNAALSGTAVINNPFWWSADEKFFNTSLAEKIGIPVPKTVLIPSKQRPTDTTETSFRNLAFPMAWEEMFQYIGFPAYMKPHDGGGWKSVYRVSNPQDLWNKHEETGQLVMMLQEEIIFDDYVRCYCIGQKDVLVMPYEPRNPHHLRYAADLKATGDERVKLLATIKEYVLKLNVALGYDFNTVEFAIRDGVPIAIDFCNPAPDADIYSVGHDNFEWVVEAAANMAIERAKKQVPGQSNLTWGTFLRDSVAVTGSAPEKITPTKAETVKVKPTKPVMAAPGQIAADTPVAPVTEPVAPAKRLTTSKTKPAKVKPTKPAIPVAEQIISDTPVSEPVAPAKKITPYKAEPVAAPKKTGIEKKAIPPLPTKAATQKTESKIPKKKP